MVWFTKWGIDAASRDKAGQVKPIMQLTRIAASDSLKDR